MSMRASRLALVAAAGIAGAGLAPLAAGAQARAQHSERAELATQADVLLRSASESSLDSLFQSVHALSKSPQDSAKVCRALASETRGQGETWLMLAQELSEPNRDALAGALGEIAMSGWRGTPAAFDEAAARKSLRQAGVRAALLNEGFSGAALATDGNATDVADTTDAEAMRCRSLGWLLDAVATQPRSERAAITRLLLREGMASMLADATNSGH